MTTFVNIGIIFSILIVGALSAELPSFIQPCRRSQSNYSECTRLLAEKSVVLIGSGAAKDDYNIPSMEPTFLDSISLGKTNSTQSWLSQSYKNIKIYGMSNPVKMNSMDVEFDKGIIRYTSSNKRIDIIADYELDGHFFLLPLHNSGRVNISFSNSVTVGSVTFKMEESNGETYIKGTKYTVDVSPGKVTVDFENLFNGRKDLERTMNKLMGDNWQTFGTEIKKILQDRCGAIFLEILNKIINSVPAKKIFPD